MPSIATVAKRLTGQTILVPPPPPPVVPPHGLVQSCKNVVVQPLSQSTAVDGLTDRNSRSSPAETASHEFL